MHAAEELHVLDLPGHDGLRSRRRASKRRDALAELAERIQANVVPPSSAASASSSRKRLALDGDDGDVVAELARGAEHEERKRAVAGDQAERRRTLLDVERDRRTPLATAAAE